MITESFHWIDMTGTIPAIYGFSFHTSDIPTQKTLQKKSYGPRGDRDWETKRSRRGAKRAR